VAGSNVGKEPEKDVAGRLNGSESKGFKFCWGGRRGSTCLGMRARIVGTRWFATLEMLKAKDLRFTRINIGFLQHLIMPAFVARVARRGPGF